MLFDDGAVTPGGLVVACVDCARFDPADHVARALALASMAPYGMVLCLAAVRGEGRVGGDGGRVCIDR